MRKLLALILICYTGGFAFAQNGFGPVAGDITVSLQLGRAESFYNLQYVQKPVNTYDGQYTLSAPYATTVSPDDNSLVNMIGVEGKYFVSDQIAVRLSGMGIIDLTPAQEETPGTTVSLYDLFDYETVQRLQSQGVTNVLIPSYASIESKTTHRFVGNIGADYYFQVASPRVHPYLGVLATLNYGRHQYYTLDDDDLGPRFFETYGIGASLTGGVDYYLAEGMFVGLEIKAFSYLYSVNNLSPMPGVESYDSDSHTIGFLTNPMFKIGFKF